MQIGHWSGINGVWMVVVGCVDRFDWMRGLHISHFSGIDEVCEIAVGCVIRIDRAYGLQVPLLWIRPEFLKRQGPVSPLTSLTGYNQRVHLSDSGQLGYRVQELK